MTDMSMGRKVKAAESAHPLSTLGSVSPARSKSGWIAVSGLLFFFLLTFVFSPTADAATQRPFKEVFGSVSTADVSETTLAVELRTGDVLLGVQAREGSNEVNSIKRFHADGTPAPFARLGTNVIDGREDNGKPCSEEPASCDVTPNGGLKIKYESQIAVDESGGVTDGDIYLSENEYGFGRPNRAWVDIFAPDGTYLGELTGPAEQGLTFGDVGGVAVDESGAVYIGAKDGSNLTTEQGLEKYVPTGNPVSNDDRAFSSETGRTNDVLNNLAIGTGPTAGSIFVIGSDKLTAEFSFLQFDSATGAFSRAFAQGKDAHLHIGIDPKSGALLASTVGNFSRPSSIVEYEASASSEPIKIGQTPITGLTSFALTKDGEVIASVYKPEEIQFRIYGTPVPVATVTADPASGVTGTEATLAGTIDPEGVPLTECYFEYGRSEERLSTEGKEEVACPTSDSAPHRVEAEIGGLESNGHTYYFRLVAVDTNGQEESPVESFTTAPTVMTEPAAPISTTSATLNGLVRPEGAGYSACYFEYGVSTSPEFERRVPCTPRAEEVPHDHVFSPQQVTAPVEGLQVAQTYRFRLVATSEDSSVGKLGTGTVEGEELTFTTQGAPRITDLAASGADQTSATLEGEVNPSGFGTSYRFEWGPTSSYGNHTPLEFEPFLGSGELPVRVTGRISGLTAGTTYHYRIVATSPEGVVASPDHVLETLNACGLMEGRCYELVSRADAGPIAVPGLREGIVQAELGYQVSPAGDAVAYPVESGYPDARSGRAVLYRALRAPAGWTSTELSPPLIAQSERIDGVSEAGQTYWLSDDLSCGFLNSSQPLTADPGTRPTLQAGGLNLYRRNADNSYTAVTSLTPENLETGFGYAFIGASQDCHKVVFETEYRYPGVPVPNSAEKSHLYEWDEGTLRGIEGTFGEYENDDRENVVSADGSRIFLPHGTMLENGVVREYAASQTETPASKVKYQWANSDGSRVFFTAESGLTAEASGGGSPEGIDLYEYDVTTGQLTDRTVVRRTGGAQVAGFVAATEDGSVVYFGSQAQLVPGRGPTLAQNEKAVSDSIYEESDGVLKYAGTSGAGLLDTAAGLFVANSRLWTSQISADGRYLLFQSNQDVTGYRSGGAYEAYLFDADGSSGGTTTCVSCRQDGQPSVAPDRYEVLPVAPLGNEYHRPRFLVVREGRPEIFFSSADALAPGASVGQNNIYEWVHDQVFRLTSAPEGSQSVPQAGLRAIFAGASADGTDVYLSSAETLSPADQDARPSIFDARVGGGFPEAPAPPAACAANAENSCQATPPPTPASPGIASGTDSGAQNFQPKKKGCTKKNCRRKHKSRHKKGRAKGRGKRTSARPAGHDRRAGR